LEVIFPQKDFGTHSCAGKNKLMYTFSKTKMEEKIIVSYKVTMNSTSISEFHRRKRISGHQKPFFTERGKIHLELV
jgi:hypothetical protein